MPNNSASHLDGDDRTSEFLRLLNQHERALSAYILTLCPHWSDSEDIAQETRLRLGKQFDKYEPGTDFAAWARSVAYYLILTHREKANRDRLRFGPAFYQCVSAAIAARPRLVAARQDALTHCMEKLDEPKRQLIESYYSEHQSLQDLARQQGRSYDAVRKAVYRTQLVLADCIESEMREKEAHE
jgi:RNA polymerase sigma-70 factor (ECF subfamily)